MHNSWNDVLIVITHPLTATSYDIHMIVEQTRRATTLLNDMQDASLFESGLLKFASEPIDLWALISGIVDIVRPSLNGYRIDMTEVSEPLMVSGDAARLEQVFHNLLGNAVKYSPDGRTIAIKITTQNQMACIEIHDNGIGIPAAAIPNLFKRFFRVRTNETEHIPGSGLGLYVVKEIVTQHGGYDRRRERRGCWQYVLASNCRCLSPTPRHLHRSSQGLTERYTPAPNSKSLSQIWFAGAC